MSELPHYTFKYSLIHSFKIHSFHYRITSFKHYRIVMKLPKSFYTRTDVLQVSKDLLGKYLVTQIDGIRTAGKIVETEAYRGPDDQACHAKNGVRTPRTEPFYMEGGIAYVYICYGIHHLFNVITGEKDLPHAVLIRGIEPTEGIEDMLIRRNYEKVKPALTAGPGAAGKAFGIHKKYNTTDLQSDLIWIEDRGEAVAESDIFAGMRVGMGTAGVSALLPYRFYIKGNKWVSKPLVATYSSDNG